MRDFDPAYVRFGQKWKGSERANVVRFAPKADVRLARSNEYTPIATRKTYARCGFVPPDDVRQESPYACHVFAIEITDKRAMRRTTDA